MATRTTGNYRMGTIIFFSNKHYSALARELALATLKWAWPTYNPLKQPDFYWITRQSIKHIFDLSLSFLFGNKLAFLYLWLNSGGVNSVCGLFVCLFWYQCESTAGIFSLDNKGLLCFHWKRQSWGNGIGGSLSVLWF